LLGPRKAACGLAPAAISSSGHGVGSPNLNKSPHAMEPAAHSCLSLSLSIESGDTPEEEASNGSGGRH
jgi:hypothetical protein